MTQTSAKRWYKEIERWAKATDGVKVWCRNEKGTEWTLKDNVIFNNDMIYVVDDEWAELRKAQIDGKQLQLLQISTNARLEDAKLDDEFMAFTDPKDWSIRPEIEFPVYIREKIQGFIVRFDDYETGTIVMSDNKNWKIGFIFEKWISCINSDAVETVEINGQTFYDTQPVLAWDHTDFVRYIGFIDAKNNCLFSSRGERNGWKPEHIMPVKHIEDWIIEAWQKLRL